jgi:cytoskeletal protein CcmA (bactofilin family)
MGFDGETLVDGAAGPLQVAPESKGFLKLALGKSKPKSRDIEPLPVVVPARMSRGQGPTIISLNVEIAGTVNSPDELHIYGKIDGNVRAASVSVCVGGTINGDVTGETVTVDGTVNGRVYGKRVHLLASAVVNGDIFHSGLGIDPDAVFEGASRRVSDPLAAGPATATKQD